MKILPVLFEEREIRRETWQKHGRRTDRQKSGDGRKLSAIGWGEG